MKTVTLSTLQAYKRAGETFSCLTAYDASFAHAASAAGIDVLDREPPEPDHPVLKRNDVIVTPHNGAASVSSSIAMARMSAENILDCFDGQLKDEMVFNLSALGSKQ